MGYLRAIQMHDVDRIRTEIDTLGQRQILT